MSGYPRQLAADIVPSAEAALKSDVGRLPLRALQSTSRQLGCNHLQPPRVPIGFNIEKDPKPVTHIAILTPTVPPRREGLAGPLPFISRRKSRAAASRRKVSPSLGRCLVEALLSFPGSRRSHGSCTARRDTTDGPRHPDWRARTTDFDCVAARFVCSSRAPAKAQVGGPLEYRVLRCQ
jgi:hypothetical protein